MTPEVIAAIGQLIDRYGLPLVILGAFGWALFTRRLILGSEKERSDAAYAEELRYREERRIEERDGRLAAEAALRAMSGSFDALGDSLDGMAETLVDAIKERPSARR